MYFDFHLGSRVGVWNNLKFIFEFWVMTQYKSKKIVFHFRDFKLRNMKFLVLNQTCKNSSCSHLVPEKEAGKESIETKLFFKKNSHWSYFLVLIRYHLERRKNENRFNFDLACFSFNGLGFCYCWDSYCHMFYIFITPKMI